jgi:hypothetical protein
MTRIVLVAVLIVATLAFAKQNHYFERSGIVHACTLVAAPAGQDGEWHSCRQGWLDGYPDLSMDSCDRMGRTADREYWRCPAPLATSLRPGS